MTPKSKLARTKKTSPKRPLPAPDRPSSAADAAKPELRAEALPEPRFPIVGIGASAGGLAAFEAFFSAMPADAESSMAFVLVQHLSPDHKSILTDLVKRYTRMRVFEVADGMKVEPNCAYIIPPNRDMAFINGTLQLLEPTAPRGMRLPIDFFFRSLAQDQRERAICIVLSGTGSDGTLGVRAVKGEGGMAMAQTPESTEYDGMPRSAIATGLVDYVLPPAEMPAQLIAYVTHIFGRRRRPAVAPAARAEDTLKKICVLLRAQTGHDFSQYKENTLVRRVERRMALHQIERADEYLQFLHKNPPEVTALFRDLLIGVTSFFRDPEAFAVLQNQVIPRLFADASASRIVRVWVCGCSTGEEAYSLAILIQEHLSTLKQAVKVQVFATDVDERAIEQARSGVYPVSIAADVSADRLTRFFSLEADGGLYRIQKTIRDLLVFSEQDVLKDPPFSKLDLISCRNLLIYMNGDLQKKLIPLFHYALNPGGMLFLGTSETVGEFATIFTAVDRKWKIYQRGEDGPGAPRPALTEFVPPLTEVEAQSRQQRSESRGEGRANLRALAEQTLLEHYAQAGVLINGRGEILHMFGRTGQFLEPAAGDAGLNILAMAREGLRRELTTALHRAVTQPEPVRYLGLRVRTNGDFISANLTVRRVAPGPDRVALQEMFLVILEEAASAEPAPAADSAGEAGASAPHIDQRIATLEQDLRNKEEYLQTTLEEMETSNEELKSTNEELQSVNEELQSTNEELETSKEELQSVNEELATVNAELQNKVADLSRANNDMNNLLAGTGVGTLFVDYRLRIARFTPAITHVINLIQTDIGRPVGHIVSNLVGYDRLVEDVQRVLESLVPQEAEVQTKAGVWYLMRIRPYRTLENVIEGAVITFVDITQRKQMEEALRRSENRFALAFRTSPDGLVISRKADGVIVEVNDSWEALFGFSRQEAVGRSSLDLGLYADPADRERGLALLDEHGAIRNLEIEIRRKSGEKRWVQLSAEQLEVEAVPCLLTIIRDVTESRRVHAELRRSEERFSKAFQASPAALSITAPDGRFVDVNDRFLALFGFDRPAVVGRTALDLGLFDTADGRVDLAPALPGEAANLEQVRAFLAKSGQAFQALTSRVEIEIAGTPHVLTFILNITGKGA
ncbi:MAG: PAS domain S-box protein [Anaerolineales bacterium]|nr:PAS domain S-box protein [Anaerolineales bacterium]